MDRYKDILSGVQDELTSAQKTYDGKKRSELKDSDFLFPETRSFPIVTPQDVKDAISSFGRMKSNISYDAFLKKLYNKCKNKGPAFVDALPEASKDKLGIKKQSTTSSKKPININADEDSYNPPANKTSILNNNDDEVPNPIDEDVMEGKCRSDEEDESYSMIINSLKNIVSNVNAILNNSNLDTVKENLTEPWVFGMIAVVDENVSKVHDFVKFNDPNDEIEEDGESDAGSKPGLWDNIRKKKEREGKNYRPAKPGDKDRPDPDMWKKLTK